MAMNTNNLCDESFTHYGKGLLFSSLWVMFQIRLYRYHSDNKLPLTKW